MPKYSDNRNRQPHTAAASSIPAYTEPEVRRGMKKLVDAGTVVWITTKEQPRPKKKGQKIKPVEPTGDLKKDFDLRYELKDKDNYGDFFKELNKR